MEDVLEVYQRPYDASRPLICLDEAAKQLIAETRQALEALTEPVHLQIFVTPTCPYCPQAVALGFEMAYASSNVRADGIESSEFPHLAIKYEVAGVPRTVINESTNLEGAGPPDVLLAKIHEALGNGQGSDS